MTKIEGNSKVQSEKKIVKIFSSLRKTSRGESFSRECVGRERVPIVGEVVAGKSRVVLCFVINNGKFVEVFEEIFRGFGFHGRDSRLEE